ncbi:MAG: hypothetical protein AB1746_11380 [Candidatus Zixiibacteriota bacterium]
MKKYFIFACLLTLAFVSNATSQMIDQADVQSAKQDYLGLNPVSKPFSLIDLSRVKWSNSYSVSFFSGGGTSTSLGYYTSSIFYEITPSLSVDMQLGIAHNPGALFNRDVDNNASFFPAVNLDYHPSERFRLSIGVASYPGYYYNPYYSYDPYRLYDWRRLTE